MQASTSKPSRASRSRLWLVAVALIFPLQVCRAQSNTTAPNGARQMEVAEDGQWPMAAKNYSNTRYCGLDQIRADNVKDLKVAWTFATGVNRGQEAAPVVIGSTMFIVTPYPNIVYAL